MAQNIIQDGGLGKAKLQKRKGRLEIRFSSRIFGKDKVVSLGMADDVANYSQALAILASINADLSVGKFDYSLQKYYLGKRRFEIPIPEIELKPAITKVWSEYLKTFRHRWKDSTFFYLSNTIQRWVESAPFTIVEASRYRNWLLGKTTNSMTKRVLTWVSSAVEWWCDQHSLPNYFKNITQGLRHKWEEKAEPRPFSDIEIDYILQRFEESKYYSVYLPLVKFLLFTGCRPSEAIGLQWRNLQEKHIVFSGGVTSCGGKMFQSDTSKNKKIRSFPLNGKIREILSIQEGKSKLWVFPAPRSCKPINYSNFSKKAWKECAGKIVPDSTPYNCRDTFISNQLKAGVPPAYVAKWCDTSIAMIERFYFAISDDYLPV